MMKFLTKMQNPKPVSNSCPWNGRRRKAKRPKFKGKDLKRMAEFENVLGTGHYYPGYSANYGSAYIEDQDDTGTISSFSTTATMDDNPGAGLTVDKYFYQPVGRAIEKFALKIAMRLNICPPSPAQIIRVLGMISRNNIFYGDARKKPGDVIARISAVRPSAVPGILTLVQQSQ